MHKEYNLHYDESHSWLEVPLADLNLLSLEHDISTCSYFDCYNIYLEEDRDLPLFYTSAINKGWKISILKEIKNHSIRKLAHFDNISREISS